MKKILPFCILAIGLGFAQEPDLTAPAPEAKPTSSESPFDAVRGHSYNPYGITGAASSVYDLVLTPSDIYGKRFFYVAPTDRLGFASFNLLGGSTLLGLTNYSSLILGYATPAFGIALDYSIQKEWTESETPNIPFPGNTTISQRTTYPGDNIGIYFSMPLGSATAYANANWYTYRESHITEVEGAPLDVNGYTKVDYSDIYLNVGMLGSVGSLNYDAYLNIERYGGTLTSDHGDFSSMGEKVVTEDSYLGVSLNANFSIQAVKNETSRILVGSNNLIGITFLDEVDPDGYGLAGGNVISLILSPNILGEVVLTDRWLAFAGARHSINFDFGADTPRDETTSETSIRQAPTQAVLGIRYQNTNWAIETQFVDNDPFAALGGENILFQFGGFIYF